MLYNDLYCDNEGIHSCNETIVDFPQEDSIIKGGKIIVSTKKTSKVENLTNVSFDADMKNDMIGGIKELSNGKPLKLQNVYYKKGYTFDEIELDTLFKKHIYEFLKDIYLNYETDEFEYYQEGDYTGED